MKNNFIFSLASNLIVSGSKFLVLYILIKLSTPTEVGNYNYALVMTAPIFLLLSLKIRTVQTTNDNYNFNECNSLIIIINLLALNIITIILFINSNAYIGAILLLVAIMKFIDNLREVVYGVFQRNEKIKYISKSLIYYNLISTLYFSLTFLLTKSLIISLFAMLIVSILFYIFYDLFFLFNEYQVKYKLILNTIKFKEILMISFPLSFSSALGSLNDTIPRMFLKNFYGSYELGIFSSIAYFLIIASLIANALSQVFLPRLSLLYREKKFNDFIKLSNKLLTLGIFIGIFIVIITFIIGKTFLVLIYGELYAKYYVALIILSIGIMFILSGVFVGTILTSMKIYNIHYKIVVFVLISNCILSFIFIPVYSIYGAAISACITQLITLLLYVYFYKKNIGGLIYEKDTK